jgi:hypothetical protein
MAADPDAEEAAKNFDDVGLKRFARLTDRRQRNLEAMRLLRADGYSVKYGKLVRDGQPVQLTLLTRREDPSMKIYLLFQNYLKTLGIDLQFTIAFDTAALIHNLRQNNYDMTPHILEIPRRFRVLQPDAISDRLLSVNAVDNYPNGQTLNSSNLKSPALDHIYEEFWITDANSQHYHDLVDAMLRLFAAKIPFITLGEYPTVTAYSRKQLCLPPVATVRWYEIAYYRPDGDCPEARSANHQLGASSQR